MKIDLYDATGVKKGDISLNKEIFEAKINPDLMHRAVVMRLANARLNIAHTLTRGEVSATTKKAFRQKGTGRARRGALSTNIVRGGGVTHGPRNDRNFTKMMPKKERRAALFSSLSAQTKDNNIFALEGFAEKVPKTKKFAELLSKFPESKNYLFVLAERNEVFEKSAANLPNVKVIFAPYLNPYDVLHAHKICFVADGIKKLESTFLSEKK
jgi:large subunit ribosomal protein L4